MKSNALALTLTALITCAAGGFLYWDARQTVVPLGNAVPGTEDELKGPALTSPSRSAVPRIAPEAPPPENGLYPPIDDLLFDLWNREQDFTRCWRYIDATLDKGFGRCCESVEERRQVGFDAAGVILPGTFEFGGDPIHLGGDC